MTRVSVALSPRGMTCPAILPTASAPPMAQVVKIVDGVPPK